MFKKVGDVVVVVTLIIGIFDGSEIVLPNSDITNPAKQKGVLTSIHKSHVFQLVLFSMRQQNELCIFSLMPPFEVNRMHVVQWMESRSSWNNTVT